MSVDFFISRAGPDAAWARWIARGLTEAGYSVVLQDWDFRPGQDFVAEMDRAMRDSKRTIVVLSRAFDRALFTVPEWTNAIARDPTGRQALLVPVRVDDIVPEGIFKTRIFIDLVGLEGDAARQALLDGVRSASMRKTGEVPFPGSVTTRFPGALPPLWRTPSERNPVFTDREAELGQIMESFASAEPPPLVAVLVGMGGVGKTAIAVEYAHRYRHLYKVVWWIRAGRQETVIADLALLADRLELNSGEQLQERAKAARDWLSAHDQWLLLIDAAERPDVAHLAIPQGGGGHVLITSRDPVWRRHGAVVELSPLSEPGAADLLAHRTGRRPDEAGLQLVNLLGYLPLAVELAGAFLEQQGIGAAEYLARLRRSGGLPMDEPTYRPPDYSVGLRAVWRESFRVLEEEAPLARDLLRLAAFLAPDDIPRPALVHGAHRLPADLAVVAADPDRLSDLVRRPRALSLVSTNDSGFSIHRLVQAVLRESLPRSDQERWAESAVLLMAHVMPHQVSDLRLWDLAGRLVSHALTAADHGVDLSVEPAATAVLLDRGATYLAETGGNREDIERRRREALRLGESMAEGPPGWLLNNHAVWLIEQDSLEEAKGLYERAVQSYRLKEGGNSPGLALTWVNLGNLAKRQGDLERARVYFERGLTILDWLPPWAEAKRAMAHDQLGMVLIEQGDFPAAATHLETAVRGYSSALGPASHPAVMAKTYLEQVRGGGLKGAISMQVITPESINANEGRLLSGEKAWHEDAEQLLRSAMRAGQPGAAVDLATLLRKSPERKAEGDAILAQAAADGDRQALYWHAREMAEQVGEAAEEEIRRSIQVGNVYSWYDLGLVLAMNPERTSEAEAAFRAALAGGYEEARNDLGILLCEWPGREAEGEAELAEAGRRGQARSWFNLAEHLWQFPDRRHEALGPLHLATNAGYLHAYGTLAYRLEELGRLDEALAAFEEGVKVGERPLRAHLADFLRRHPELQSAHPTA